MPSTKTPPTELLELEETGEEVQVKRGVFYWAPVFLALGFVAQIALLGYKPAMAEGRRLQREEVRLGGLLSEQQATMQRLGAEVHAHTDPIYRERLRRLTIVEAPQPGDLAGR